MRDGIPTNTFIVGRVCLHPAVGDEQPTARVHPNGQDDFIRRFCEHVSACLLTPYCSRGAPSVFDFCASLPRESSSHGTHLLRTQAAHALSTVYTAEAHDAYPTPTALHFRRAGILGLTGNIAHDLLINGGLLDLFASSHGGASRLDALLLDVGQRFDELLAARRDSWQLAVTDALFNLSGAIGGPPLLPLRSKRIVCVDELVWKPPLLDYNPVSRTPAAWPHARRRLLRSFHLDEARMESRSIGSRASAIPQRRASADRVVILYTRGDAGRRRLLLDHPRLHHGWRAHLGVTRVIHSMPSSPKEQLGLFARCAILPTSLGMPSPPHRPW